MSNLPSKLGNSNLSTQSKPTLWYVHVQNPDKFVDGTAWELGCISHSSNMGMRHVLQILLKIIYGDLVYTIYSKHSEKRLVWSGNRLLLPWWWMSPQSGHAQQKLPAWDSRNLHCRVGQIPAVLRASFRPHIAGSDWSGLACLAKGDIHSAQCPQLDGPGRVRERDDRRQQEDEEGRWWRKMRKMNCPFSSVREKEFISIMLIHKGVLYCGFTEAVKRLINCAKCLKISWQEGLLWQLCTLRCPATALCFHAISVSCTVSWLCDHHAQ